MAKPRTQSVQDESGGGRGWHVIARPDPRLAGLLARPYVGFRQQKAHEDAWLEPPQPAVTLMIGLHGQLRAGGRALPDAWMSGLGDTYDAVEVSGSYAAIDLKLTPLGAYTLLGLPLNHLAGRVCRLDDLFGAEGLRLTDRIAEATEWAQRFDVLETFLLARAGRGPRPDPAVVWAWSRLRDTSGRASVAALAAELGCSRRHLTARFGEQVGQPPKTVARLLRFERARRLLQTTPMGWAEIAYSCGYYDQSHLNREFRDLAGTTPGVFARRRVAASAVAGNAVTFVQDSGGGFT